MSASPLRVILLGGVSEVGKNSTLFEWEEELVLVDAGVKFPEEELHGVDLVIPDWMYVAERGHRLKGVLFTHGHEDHIGGLPFLLMQLGEIDPLPIYGTPMTLGLIRNKLREHGQLDRVIPYAVKAGEPFTLGSFKIEAVDVNHSVPGAVGFAIDTPMGTIFHTGDFKFDPSPRTVTPPTGIFCDAWATRVCWRSSPTASGSNSRAGRPPRASSTTAWLGSSRRPRPG